MLPPQLQCSAAAHESPRHSWDFSLTTWAAGIFTVPGLCRTKTSMKPATKAGKREIFGKMTIVKAKPAKKIVKAFPVAALKASI